MTKSWGDTITSRADCQRDFGQISSFPRCRNHNLDSCSWTENTIHKFSERKSAGRSATMCKKMGLRFTSEENYK
jgi:hypothetical protein